MASAKFLSFGTVRSPPTTRGFQVHGVPGGSPLVKPMTVQPMKLSAFVPKTSPLETAGQVFTARPPATPKVKPALGDAPLSSKHVRLNNGETAHSALVYLAEGALGDFESHPKILIDLHRSATVPGHQISASTMQALEDYDLFDGRGRLHPDYAAAVRAIIKFDASNKPRLVDPLAKAAGHGFGAWLAERTKVSPSPAEIPVVAWVLPHTGITLNTGETVSSNVLTFTKHALEALNGQPAVLTDLYLAAHDSGYKVFPSTLTAVQPFGLFDLSGSLSAEIAASVRAIIKMDALYNPRLVDPSQR